MITFILFSIISLHVIHRGKIENNVVQTISILLTLLNLVLIIFMYIARNGFNALYKYTDIMKKYFLRERRMITENIFISMSYLFIILL